MKPTKLIVAAISLILVVGIVIGLIASSGHKGHSKKDDDGDVLSTTSKSVSTICGQTDYKQQCVNSVGSIANNQSATPADFIKAAIDFTINTVKSALNNTGSLGINQNNSTQKMAVEDCKDLLQSAIDELQSAFSSVGDSDLHTIKDKEDELTNWLSAVISYQQTCLDGLDSPDLQQQMSSLGLLNATQLTSNALALVSAVSQFMETFNISFSTDDLSSTSSRRLLELNSEASLSKMTDDEGYGYPTWMSGGDRKLLASRGAAAGDSHLTPNAIVAQDGSGQYKTIAAALAAYPKQNTGSRYVIYVKAGIYEECITITKDQTNIYMYGDGPRKTIVTGHKSFIDGITTYRTATFSVMGNGFVCKSMGFQNTAGAIGHQAVALRVQADMAAFYNCRMDGYQDTLYQQAKRQFYRNCVISGTIDFIFGDSSAIIQNSLIIVRQPMKGQQNTVTAHGRADKRETTGLVIQNCRIVPEEKLYAVSSQYPSYLGRPWKAYARTVIMESTIGDFIQPAGWLPWAGSMFLDTLYYAEYGNRGPGAVTTGRVKWKGFHVLTDKNQVTQFTTGPFIQGSQWLPTTGFPHFLGMKNA